jgi:hypothetical protein
MKPLGPGLHVLTEPDPVRPERPVTVIVQCHEQPPHQVVNSIRIRAISQLQQLMRSLKRQHDTLIEETRARVRPKSCGSGQQVPRRPTLYEMDGD